MKLDHLWGTFREIYHSQHNFMTTHCEFREKLSSSGHCPTNLVLGGPGQLAHHAHDDELGPHSSQRERVAGSCHPASPLSEGRE